MWLIAMGLISAYLCFRWGNWKNYRLYYPTILFYIVSDLSHIVLTEDRELWLIRGSFWNDTLADYFISFIIAPPIVMLFLSNWPKGIKKQAKYIFFYVFIFSLIEYIAFINKGITYYNGWNTAWTTLVYALIFILLPLHHKYPLLAWLIFIIASGFVVVYFKISLMSLR